MYMNKQIQSKPYDVKVNLSIHNWVYTACGTLDEEIASTRRTKSKNLRGKKKKDDTRNTVLYIQRNREINEIFTKQIH